MSSICTTDQRRPHLQNPPRLLVAQHVGPDDRLPRPSCDLRARRRRIESESDTRRPRREPTNRTFDCGQADRLARGLSERQSRSRGRPPTLRLTRTSDPPYRRDTPKSMDRASSSRFTRRPSPITPFRRLTRSRIPTARSRPSRGRSRWLLIDSDRGDQKLGRRQAGEAGTSDRGSLPPEGQCDSRSAGSTPCWQRRDGGGALRRPLVCG